MALNQHGLEPNWLRLFVLFPPTQTQSIRQAGGEKGEQGLAGGWESRGRANIKCEQAARGVEATEKEASKVGQAGFEGRDTGQVKERQGQGSTLLAHPV